MDDVAVRTHRQSALRAWGLALVYLFILQSSLSPLATLRMESTASIFGVRCLPTAGDPTPDAAAHGACCDAACLLHMQGAAAPPAPPATAVAPARIARVVFVSSPYEETRPRAHGLRPQSQRAPPSA